jgi:hypothetical protein
MFSNSECKPLWNISNLITGALAALSLCVASLLSPVIVAWCRRKSTRLTAVFGGLLAALGLLFTSFASQFHQLFLSYGLILGNGLTKAGLRFIQFKYLTYSCIMLIFFHSK